MSNPGLPVSPVNTDGRSVLSVVPAVCCYCDFNDPNHTFPVFASVLCSLPWSLAAWSPVTLNTRRHDFLWHRLKPCQPLWRWRSVTSVTVKQLLCQTKQTPRHSQPALRGWRRWPDEFTGPWRYHQVMGFEPCDRVVFSHHAEDFWRLCWLLCSLIRVSKYIPQKIWTDQKNSMNQKWLSEAHLSVMKKNVSITYGSNTVPIYGNALPLTKHEDLMEITVLLISALSECVCVGVFFVC